MRDLRSDLSNVWRTASRISATAEGARTLMFVSARDGEGTTSVAASFACLAARRVEKPAWLVDLDIRRNAAFKGFETGFAKGIGRPGRAYDASLNEKPIYAVLPQTDAALHTKLLTVHDIEATRLMVTRFRNERLSKGQRVQVRTSPAWWAAVRKVSDWVVADAPSLERSPAALAMASQMDGVVIVVNSDSTSAEDVTNARRELEAHGGQVIGLAMNRVGADAKFFDRFSG